MSYALIAVKVELLADQLQPLVLQIGPEKLELLVDQLQPLVVQFGPEDVREDAEVPE